MGTAKRVGVLTAGGDSPGLNAAIRGFAEAGSDGIIQVSTGGAAYFSGSSVKDMVAGSLAFAAFAREVAKKYSVNIALHTDHCPKDKLDEFVRPLLDASEEEYKAHGTPLFVYDAGIMRARYRAEAPRLIVVEPERAACLLASLLRTHCDAYHEDMTGEPTCPSALPMPYVPRVRVNTERG